MTSKDNTKEEGVVNHYLNSVVAPLKTLTFKEGVLLVEDVKAPKPEGTMEERLKTLEEAVFRYGTVVERSLDAHHFMNLEMEKKVNAYEARIKDLEENYLHTLQQLEKFQALMWDMENQNCENEERFKKIAEGATLKHNLPMSFYNGKPYPWKDQDWDAHYEETDVKEEEQANP
ncbi:hypothetical protein QYE76_026909 [Lolium multiflorum]|uniref:Uncharacterized protein n=1 Tax=Lolium multiflorum TaxID=4521 RepID=A0AAD8VVN4_LOLMU|nr:hypothetical protein QYE76_026909 [Lolium multiflorum]